MDYHVGGIEFWHVKANVEYGFCERGGLDWVQNSGVNHQLSAVDAHGIGILRSLVGYRLP